MSALRIVAIALIVVGALALAYGGFNYTKESHSTKVGSIELSVKDKTWVGVPMWAGAGVMAVGGLLLLVRRKV